MSDNSLFESSTSVAGGQDPTGGTQQEAAPQQQQAERQVSQPQPTDLLGLVNGTAGTNYESFDKLGAGLKAKEEHIRNLEAENAMFREKLSKIESIEEKLSKMTEQQAQPPQEAKEVFDEQKLAAMLDSTLQQREAQRVAQENELAVSRALQERFGDKAGAMLQAKATEMGVDLKFLQSVAQKSPKAIMAYFNESSSKVPSVHTSSVQTTAQLETKADAPVYYSYKDVSTTRSLNQKFLDTMKEFAGDENPYSSKKKHNWF